MRSILICDDEPIVRMSLKNKLTELGFDDIVECGDGEQAVRMALAKLPDVIILDVSMPKKDGIAAARQIRQSLTVPIILLTACYDADTVARARECGIGGFLAKPFREQDLWPAIELACAHAEAVELLKEQVEDLKEALENRKIVEKAKGILMQKQGLTEPEAFRKMQKLAMDKRKSMRRIAEAILLAEA